MWQIKITADPFPSSIVKPMYVHVEKLEDFACSCQPGSRVAPMLPGDDDCDRVPCLVWVVKVKGLEIYRAPSQPAIVASQVEVAHV